MTASRSRVLRPRSCRKRTGRGHVVCSVRTTPSKETARAARRHTSNPKSRVRPRGPRDRSAPPRDHSNAAHGGHVITLMGEMPQGVRGERAAFAGRRGGERESDGEGGAALNPSSPTGWPRRRRGPPRRAARSKVRCTLTCCPRARSWRCPTARSPSSSSPRLDCGRRCSCPCLPRRARRRRGRRAAGRPRERRRAGSRPLSGSSTSLLIDLAPWCPGRAAGMFCASRTRAPLQVRSAPSTSGTATGRPSRA